MPPNVCDQLRGCDVLAIESNHDLEMLRGGPYPWSVKQWFGDPPEHLSNDKLAKFLCSEYDSNASYIVLEHLSELNDQPELALGTAEKALGRRQTLLLNRVVLAQQSEPMAAIQL